jgi:hypothetical protein
MKAVAASIESMTVTANAMIAIAISGPVIIILG